MNTHTSWVVARMNPKSMQQHNEISTLDAFRHLAKSDLPDWDVLAQSVKSISLRKGETLFTAGEEKPYVFVLNTGVLKMVYETPRGDRWISSFVPPGGCFASLTALKTGGVASFSVDAVTDSKIDQINFSALEQLADRHMQWQRGFSNVMRYYARAKEKREMELMTLPPEERYAKFLIQHAAIAGHIRQCDIASYVRVTPVALSRIKRRLCVRACEAC